MQYGPEALGSSRLTLSALSILLIVCTADAKFRHILEDQEQIVVPSKYVATMDSAPRLFEKVATTKREILFTTTKFDGNPDEVLQMYKNFCYYISLTKALRHLLIFTTDNRTWSILHSEGMPAYLDMAFPQRPEYRNGSIRIPGTDNRVFDLSKHFWGSTMINHNYSAAYLDGDAIVFQNPFLPFVGNDYDVQGLSDLLGASLPTAAEQLEKGCSTYYWVWDDSMGPRGAILKEIFTNSDKNKLPHMLGYSPCQSTGVWYLRPTPKAKAFMLALVDRVTRRAVHQWEQTAWNEVIQPFLWGTGEVEEPLKYRLLPKRSYANIGVLEDRQRENLPIDLVVLHAGWVHGKDKIKTYQRLGYFYPELWNTSWAAEVMAMEMDPLESEPSLDGLKEMMATIKHRVYVTGNVGLSEVVLLLGMLAMIVAVIVHRRQRRRWSLV